jgi:AraC family transcriptional regulator
MDIRTETIGDVHLAAIRHVGPYDRIGAAFEKLDRWASGKKIVQGAPRLIAIYHDDPNAVPAEKLRADAGVEVPPGFKGPGFKGGEVKPVKLVGGRYAVTQHRGSYDSLGDAWAAFRRNVAAKDGMAADERPCFEVYINTPRNAAPPDLLTELYLPIKG